MSGVDSSALDEAIVQVTSQYRYRVVNRTLAERLILKVYTLRTPGKTGDKFRALFDDAIKACRVRKREVRKYQLVLGRYFNIRSLKKRGKRSVLAQEQISNGVVEASATQAKIEVIKDVVVRFEARGPSRGRLSWEQVVDRGVPSFLLPREVQEAKKQALAVMNSKRAARA